jgi:hypothetical protein
MMFMLLVIVTTITLSVIMPNAIMLSVVAQVSSQNNVYFLMQFSDYLSSYFVHRSACLTIIIMS